jgi:hypothetical protein
MHYVMLVLTLYAPGCGPVERQIKFPNIRACDAAASALDHGEPVGGPQQMIVYHCEQH